MTLARMVQTYRINESGLSINSKLMLSIIHVEILSAIATFSAIESGDNYSDFEIAFINYSVFSHLRWVGHGLRAMLTLFYYEFCE